MFGGGGGRRLVAAGGWQRTEVGDEEPQAAAEGKRKTGQGNRNRGEEKTGQPGKEVWVSSGRR